MEVAILIVYFISLSILFAFGLHGLVMIYYYHKTRAYATPDIELPEVLPMVTVQLPVFNEVYVIERLVNAVCEMDYPKDKLEIQLLDDSTDETVEVSRRLVAEWASRGFDIKHIHRIDRTGFKAGALKSGLEKAKGEFVAIFDADFVPNSDFLMKTIPHFRNDGVGMVQTRWEHLNEDYSYLTRAQALALDGHFVIEQQVRNKAGFFINFNGTAGIWRKSCIFDAGNWHADTLAEDLDLSYSMFEMGFNVRRIPTAFVWHKRRTNWTQFVRQVYNFGFARITVAKRHPGALKLLHAAPALYTIGLIAIGFLSVFHSPFWLVPFGLHAGALGIEASFKTRSLWIGFLSVFAGLIQLVGYGSGFLHAAFAPSSYVAEKP